MAETRAEHLRDFQVFVDMARRVSDLIRVRPEFGPGTDEGHFINENTLIRVYQELECIRQSPPVNGEDWIANGRDKPGYSAYVTLYLYCTSIVHGRGQLKAEYGQGRKSRSLSIYQKDYSDFCASIPDMQPLKAGERLKLPVSQPDFFVRLLNGVETFAQQVLGTGPTSSSTTAHSRSSHSNASRTSVPTCVFGPTARGNG